MNIKDRLIKEAMGLFAEKGYEKTSVADICEAAEANIAAVNYHFQGKSNLYAEVMREANRISENHLMDAFNVLGEEASAEEKLACFIRSMCQQVFSENENGCFFRLFAFEVADSTGMACDYFEEFLELRRRVIHGVLDDLLGDKASPQRVHLCALSIISQFQFYNFSRVARKSISGPWKHLPEVEAIAEHIINFSLAGVEASKKL